MNKVPTVMLVAIISATGGAGFMWLLTHGPGSRANLPSENGRLATRAGVAERETPAAAVEPRKTTAPRMDAAILRALAEPEARNDALSVPAQKSPDRTPRSGESPAAKDSIPPAMKDAPASPLNPAVPPEKFDKKKVNRALAAALEAAAPFAKSGFIIRDDHWGGALAQSPRAVQHQLFRGNEYWFWLGSDAADSGVEVHVYDAEGNVAETDHWQRGNVAGAHIKPANTGTYYIVVSAKPRSAPKASPAPPIHWALAYGYRN